MGIASVKEIEVPPPWTEEGHLRFHEWYLAMLARGPVALDEASGIYQFFSYDGVRDFLFRPENWSTAKRLEMVPPELRVTRLLTSDPPQHVDLRSHFSSAYRPKRIVELEARVRKVCRDLLDRCIEKGTFDVIADFAKPLTVIMISEIIGIPPEKHDLMGPMSLSVYLGKVDKSGKPDLASALYSGGAQPGYQLIAPYFQELIEERRREPKDDLVSALARIPAEQMKDRLDVSALLFEQFGAGTNTTVHLIGSMMAMLDMHRDQLAKLRQDRSLVPGAVEETLRYHSPLQARQRLAVREVEVQGVQLPEGTSALCWLGAANVDPAKFVRPLDYDVTRSPNHHLGFGFGEHHCLGAHLARVEARMALDVWLECVTDFERADSGPLPWAEDFILHGLDHFRVTVKPS